VGCKGKAGQVKVGSGGYIGYAGFAAVSSQSRSSSRQLDHRREGVGVDSRGEERILRWIHGQFPADPGLRRFAWQEGAGVFSVSHSATEKVRGYIARQEEHHGKYAFEAEFIGLLDAHGIEYDERCVFD
jgi:hypothetical protein